MKIAFDSQIFTLQEYGGISRYICSLAAQLAVTEDTQAKIFAPFYVNRYLAALPKNLVSGIRIPKLPRATRAVQWASSHLARSAIAHFAPQIVHETYYSTHTTAPKSASTVMTVYDMVHERLPAQISAHDRGISESKRHATERADHVICISESTRNDLLEFFNLPEDKVSVVYLGFDQLRAIPSPASDPEPGAKNIDSPYLLYVGARGGYKNFDGFLRAFAASSRLRAECRIVCFGGGPFSSNETKLLGELNLLGTQIQQMNGNDCKLAELYQGAALFVYPSHYEGFGIPPLEAMSLHCPVACSNTSSIPEVAGNAAEYFEPSDMESMRTAMENVLDSTTRRNQLIENGTLRCAQFSWARCADDTRAIYERLV